MDQANLTIVQGTPFRFLVRVKHRNEADILVPRPLTGHVVRLQARPHVDSSKLLLDLSSDGEGIVVDEEAGTFMVELSSQRTSSLVWGQPHTKARAVYHCEIDPPDGETIRILAGLLTLDPEVVR